MKYMAATLAMVGMAEKGGPFDTGQAIVPTNPYEGETEEERRKRLHKMYGDHSQEHEFVIGGERIMARDRKTAMKICARKHPKKKKK